MKSVLLVDDEPVISAAVQNALTAVQFRVHAVYTVEQALRVVRQSRFDAILLEFNLKSKRKTHPRTGTGLQLVCRLRGSVSGTPILILTSMSGPIYEAAALEVGADGFVEKTNGIPFLVACLRAAMGQRSRRCLHAQKQS